MIKSIIKLATIMLAIIPLALSGQVVVGGTVPDPSSALDVQSNSKGVLLPRISTAQRDAMTSPATGLAIFNTSTNCLEINLGTPAAVSWVRMKCRNGSVTSLDCANATVTGTFYEGVSAADVRVNVPYQGGNGGVYDAWTASSTGVSGLTASLAAGNFAEGSGSLELTFSGMTASTGTASFALEIGGQTCTLNVTVSSVQVCRAKVNATEYKNFLCYNLGAANTSADPFTPSWEIHGGYWQWGRSAEAAAGPTASDPRAGVVSGWSSASAADGSWTDGSKTPNDPCPSGYRVPTKAQWEAVIANNSQFNLGTFADAALNYTAGKKFGNQLMLPAAGSRLFSNGSLLGRGNAGGYWSSTQSSSNRTWSLAFGSANSATDENLRNFGRSIRCIAE